MCAEQLPRRLCSTLVVTGQHHRCQSPQNRWPLPAPPATVASACKLSEFINVGYIARGPMSQCRRPLQSTHTNIDQLVLCSPNSPTCPHHVFIWCQVQLGSMVGRPAYPHTSPQLCSNYSLRLARSDGILSFLKVLHKHQIWRSLSQDFGCK